MIQPSAVLGGARGRRRRRRRPMTSDGGSADTSGPIAPATPRSLAGPDARHLVEHLARAGGRAPASSMPLASKSSSRPPTPDAQHEPAVRERLDRGGLLGEQRGVLAPAAASRTERRAAGRARSRPRRPRARSAARSCRRRAGRACRGWRSRRRSARRAHSSTCSRVAPGIVVGSPIPMSTASILLSRFGPEPRAATRLGPRPARRGARGAAGAARRGGPAAAAAGDVRGRGRARSGARSTRSPSAPPSRPGCAACAAAPRPRCWWTATTTTGRGWPGWSCAGRCPWSRSGRRWRRWSQKYPQYVERAPAGPLLRLRPSASRAGEA